MHECQNVHSKHTPSPFLPLHLMLGSDFVFFFFTEQRLHLFLLPCHIRSFSSIFCTCLHAHPPPFSPFHDLRLSQSNLHLTFFSSVSISLSVSLPLSGYLSLSLNHDLAASLLTHVSPLLSPELWPQGL